MNAVAQADASADWRAASGRSARATPRRAWRWPRARTARSASVLVMDTAPATKLSAIERLGATIVKATYDECWRAVESHASDRMTGRLVHPFDDDDFISGNGTAALEILEDLPDVDAVIAPIGGGGLLAGHRRGAAGADGRTRGVYGAEPETAAPLAASLAAQRAGALRRVDGVVRGRRGRQVGAAVDVAAALESVVSDSIVVSLAEAAAAMKFAAERCHVIIEGAAACADRRRAFAAHGRRRPQERLSRSSPAATSISRDLPRSPALCLPPEFDY